MTQGNFTYLHIILSKRFDRYNDVKVIHDMFVLINSGLRRTSWPPTGSVESSREILPHYLAKSPTSSEFSRVQLLQVFTPFLQSKELQPFVAFSACFAVRACSIHRTQYLSFVFSVVHSHGTRQPVIAPT